MNKTTLAFTLMFGLSSSAAFANGNAACGGNLMQLFKELDAAAIWRQTNTHSTPSGDFVASSATREAAVTKRAGSMQAEILGLPPFDKVNGHAETPPFEMFAADGTAFKRLLKKTGGMDAKQIVGKYGDDIHQLHENGAALVGILPNGDGEEVAKFSVALAKLDAERNLPVTMLLPVSGHTGPANAKAWAKTDTYTLKLTMNGVSKDLVKDAKSLDVITAQELVIPLKDLKPGDKATLEYWRSGSGGPGGYAEGRLIEFVADAK